MLKKIPNESLFVSEPNPKMFGNHANAVGDPYWTNQNWLKSRFHFSFAEYHDRNRTNYGVLRVMNDDLVQPARGFGTHGHRDAEICTYVVRGSLTHQDSMGTKETLGRGSVQFMTAGSGVQHSEHNLDPKQDLRFIQMWFTPRKRSLQPNYGSLMGSPAVDQARKGKWAHLVSDVEASVETPVQISTDVNIFVSQFSANDGVLQKEILPGRQAYCLCIEGKADLSMDDGSTEQLVQHDACQIRSGTLRLRVPEQEGSEEAHILMVEMAADA